MNVTIERLDLQQFVQEQVRAGRFTSAEDVIAAALDSYQESTQEDDFDDGTAAGLRASFEDAENGRTMTVDEAAARLGMSVAPERGQSGAA